MLKLGSRGLALAATLALAAPAAHAEAPGPTVFAAASMKTAFDAIVGAWKAKTGKSAIVSYGSSGTLAKQIQSGAPADLFISADQKWMDVLAKGGALAPDTRENLLGNALVLVAPAARGAGDDDRQGLRPSPARWETGKLAVCTIASCPAGIYGKEALTNLGVWPAVEPKLAQADNVRAALLLVARDEAKFGIVYATDAKAEPKVKVVGTFPESSHTPIVYPVAVTKESKNPDAAALEAFLRSPEAVKILEGQGFTVLGH